MNRKTNNRAKYKDSCRDINEQKKIQRRQSTVRFLPIIIPLSAKLTNLTISNFA